MNNSYIFPFVEKIHKGRWNLREIVTKLEIRGS